MLAASTTSYRIHDALQIALHHSTPSLLPQQSAAARSAASCLRVLQGLLVLIFMERSHTTQCRFRKATKPCRFVLTMLEFGVAPMMTSIWMMSACSDLSKESRWLCALCWLAWNIVNSINGFCNWSFTVIAILWLIPIPIFPK